MTITDEAVSRLVKAVLDGKCVAVFAYGIDDLKGIYNQCWDPLKAVRPPAEFRRNRIAAPRGGEILFCDLRNLDAARGLVADLVYVCDPDNRVTEDQARMIAAAAAMGELFIERSES